MKSAYLMIVAEKEILPTSPIYKVYVGTSASDQHDLQFLQDYCAAHNYYFAVYSHDVATFLSNIANSLNVPLVELYVQSINVHQMVMTIKRERSVPNSHVISSHSILVREKFSPDRYFSLKLRVIHHAEAETRIKPKAKRKRTQGRKPQSKDESSADGKSL